MARETTTTSTDALIAGGVRATQVYAMAFVCLAIGLGIGYVAGGVRWSASEGRTASIVPSVVSPAGSSVPGHVVTLSDMKQMADKQAASLLESLKNDPSNGAVLAQVGAIYHSAHQFTEAAAYYQRAVKAEPKNVALRTRLASSLYRSGDVDGAIAQLNQALAENPNDANSLFNLGMMRMQGKHDARGAATAWQKLLKTNPQLSAAQKAEVQKLLSEALTMPGDQQAIRREQAHAVR